MMVCSRLKLTSPPPAAAMSKSASHTSSAPSSGSPSARKNSAKRQWVMSNSSASLSWRRISTDVLLGDFGHGGVHGRPLAARAAVDAVGYGNEQLFRPAPQRLLDDRVSLLFPQFGTQCS